MLGLDILEVAIGMAFLYVLMSLLASAVREAIEGFMRTRAVDLERGIIEMLRKDTTESSGAPADFILRLSAMLPISLTGARPNAPPTSDNMAAELYAHPLVSSLYRGNYEQARAGGTLPSYIPRENFATAILDLVAGASKSGKQLSIASLMETLTPPKTPAPPATTASSGETTPGLNAVQRVVLTALSTAQGDLDKTRHAIEAWYDTTNDRVASWYKRRTGIILFIIGLGTAIAFNVDSVTIGKALWTDPLLRKAIVEQADAYAKADAEANSKAPPKPGGPAAGEPQEKSAKDLAKELERVGFPIGWSRDSKTKGLYPTRQAHCAVDKTSDDMAADGKEAAGNTIACTAKDKDELGFWFSALLGWLITAVAVMLGAPFWFDLLNKFISLRTAMKPPGPRKTKTTAN